jgi:hypothetical protein
MATTRQIPDTEDVTTTLNPSTFKQILNILKRGKLDEHPFDSGMKVHCHIPVCIGYGSETMSVDDLTALVNGVTERGYDLTVYAAPRKKFDNEDEDPYIAWQRENQSILKVIGSRIVLESEWRKSPAWKEANDRYNSFKTKDPDLIERLLTDDVKKWVRRQANKRNSNPVTQQAEVETREHQLACVVDSISWMTPEGCSKINKLNVLMYTHDLPGLMRNAIQNAKNIGYVQGSLQHIKPEFELQHVKMEAYSAVSPVQYAQGLSSDGLSTAETQALETITSLCLDKKVDELYLAKVVAHMVNAFESQRRQSHQPEMAPIATSISSSAAESLKSTDSYSGNNRYTSPGGLARVGLFAAPTSGNRVISSSSAAALTAASASAATVLANSADSQISSTLMNSMGSGGH